MSLRSQRGNADDALLRRLYGPRWRGRLEIPPGRRGRHTAITVAALAAAGLAIVAARSRQIVPTAAACAAAGVWAAGTAEFATHRILPGPRDRREVAVVVATSIAIPPLAVAHWLHGWWRWRGARPVGSGTRIRRPAEASARRVRENGPTEATVRPARTAR